MTRTANTGYRREPWTAADIIDVDVKRFELIALALAVAVLISHEVTPHAAGVVAKRPRAVRGGLQLRHNARVTNRTRAPRVRRKRVAHVKLGARVILMSNETKEEAIKNHNGWGRSMWLTKESSKEGKQRALEIARLAGDEEAVAYLEGLLR